MPKPYSIDLRKKIVVAYENEEGSMQKLGICRKNYLIEIRYYNLFD